MFFCLYCDNISFDIILGSKMGCYIFRSASARAVRFSVAGTKCFDLVSVVAAEQVGDDAIGRRNGVADDDFFGQKHRDTESAVLCFAAEVWLVSALRRGKHIANEWFYEITA